MAEQVGSSARREREFLRYAETVHGLKTSQRDVTAISSTDLALTAYAQLVALRLNAKRGVVSLFNNHSQYILAEATKTLSLQRDDIHDADDALYWGSSVLPRRDDFFTQSLKPHKHRTDLSVPGATVINDLEHDAAFYKHPYVVEQPFARSFAGVPLTTPRGFPIGILAILDDKPRPDGISGIELQFMQDVATTIISHLEMERIRLAHRRGTRMVKGLSRFMEGKNSVDDDLDLQEGQRLQNFAEGQALQTSKLTGSHRTQALNTASNSERMDHAYQQASDRLHSRASIRDIPDEASRRLQQEVASAPSSPTLLREDSAEKPASHRSSLISQISPEDPGPAHIQQDVRDAFGRAAKIIQQATDVSGVLFVDASRASFDREGRLSEEGSTRDSTDHDSTSDASSKSEGSKYDGAASSQRTSSRRRLCAQLGSAYELLTDGDPTRLLHRGIPVRFLSSLIRAFPYGHAFSFDDNDCLLSSDEVSDSSNTVDHENEAEKKSSETRQRRRNSRTGKLDHTKILELFPGVRTLSVMPMWDSHRERFFAAAIVWSYSSTRVLSFQDDVNYIGAFCDVLMSEVGRLDSQAEVRAKQDFISSISHELRSPLHGILGSVDVLQDADERATTSMLQMIDTCGRSLLDIINNLLAHAQVAGSRTSLRSSTRKRRAAKARLQRHGQTTGTLTDPVCDLALVTEEYLDTALWSTSRASHASSSRERIVNPQSTSAAPPLQLILDIDPTNLTETGWNFHVDSGAWRRILQNITTNAIKCTDHDGYCKITLAVRANSTGTSANTQRVELTISDSGKGMSQEYLKEGLWRPFQQEDSHAQGTGLGLSLVHGLIEEMGGTIDAQSTKGVGTTFSVVIPLLRATSPVTEISTVDDGTSRRKRVRGCTYALLGFAADEDDNKRASEATEILRNALEKTCSSLELIPCDVDASKDARPDIFIVSEQMAASMAQADMQYATTSASTESNGAGMPRSSPVFWDRCIILCSSMRSSRDLTRDIGRATIVLQPLGPRKLLNSAISCLDKGAGTSPLELPENIGSLSRPQLQTLASDESLVSPSSLVETWVADVVPSRPAATPSSQERLPENRPPGPSSPTSTSFPVLLVDDNGFNLTLLQRYMKKLGHDQQMSATNGLEALEAYQDACSKLQDPSSPRSQSAHSPAPPSRPMVIFMDLMMPIMDGLESTRRIRALERSLGLQQPAMIVALTAQASAEAQREAYSCGVDVFLSKPVRIRQLGQIFEDLEKKGRDGGGVGAGKEVGR